MAQSPSKRQREGPPPGDDDALSMLLQVLYQAAVARKALLSQLDSLNDCLRATDLIFQKLSTTHEAVLSSISDLRSEQEILRELRKRARTAALTTGVDGAAGAATVAREMASVLQERMDMPPPPPRMPPPPVAQLPIDAFAGFAGPEPPVIVAPTSLTLAANQMMYGVSGQPSSSSSSAMPPPSSPSTILSAMFQQIREQATDFHAWLDQAGRVSASLAESLGSPDGPAATSASIPAMSAPLSSVDQQPNAGSAAAAAAASSAASSSAAAASSSSLDVVPSVAGGAGALSQVSASNLLLQRLLMLELAGQLEPDAAMAAAVNTAMSGGLFAPGGGGVGGASALDEFQQQQQQQQGLAMMGMGAAPPVSMHEMGSPLAAIAARLPAYWHRALPPGGARGFPPAGQLQAAQQASPEQSTMTKLIRATSRLSSSARLGKGEIVERIDALVAEAKRSPPKPPPPQQQQQQPKHALPQQGIATVTATVSAVAGISQGVLSVSSSGAPPGGGGGGSSATSAAAPPSSDALSEFTDLFATAVSEEGSKLDPDQLGNLLKGLVGALSQDQAQSVTE